MSRYKVGDKVKVLDGSNCLNYRCGWVTNMNNYVGRICEIVSIDEDEGTCELSSFGGGWTYDMRYLERVFVEDEKKKHQTERRTAENERNGGRGAMKDTDFIKLVKKTVADYTNKHLDKTDEKKITEDDVFIVWIVKALQNNKALASTTLFDGMYYELTYNGDKHEMYVDAYKKWENYCVKVSENDNEQ